MCVAQKLKHYHDPEDLCREECELNNEETAAVGLHGTASPMEIEGELLDMKAEEMAQERFYLVKSYATAIPKGANFSPSRKGLEYKNLPGRHSLPLCYLIGD